MYLFKKMVFDDYPVLMAYMLYFPYFWKDQVKRKQNDDFSLNSI